MLLLNSDGGCATWFVWNQGGDSILVDISLQSWWICTSWHVVRTIHIVDLCFSFFMCLFHLIEYKNFADQTDHSKESKAYRHLGFVRYDWKELSPIIFKSDNTIKLVITNLIPILIQFPLVAIFLKCIPTFILKLYPKYWT